MSSDRRPSHIDGPDRTRRPSDWRITIVLFAFLAIAGFFLLTEHRAHFFGFLPFLLLLACPLLHVFMHRGHGKHEGDGPDAVIVRSEG